jgi:hypothetical protein
VGVGLFGEGESRGVAGVGGVGRVGSVFLAEDVGEGDFGFGRRGMSGGRLRDGIPAVVEAGGGLGDGDGLLGRLGSGRVVGEADSSSTLGVFHGQLNLIYRPQFY